MLFRVAILTVSDRGSRGERPEDLSAAAAREALAPLDHTLAAYTVVPDERDAIAAQLRAWADSGAIDLILTTGGTGLAPSDATPEQTKPLLDKEIPQLAAELARHGVEAGVPTAVLSRGLAGLAGQTLIVNLPGSLGGAADGMTVLGPLLPHAVAQLRGGDHRRLGH